ncbi:MAG: TfoX/Sxy family protein [Actinomycetia bacterium]|nr:TfoX/Sxy family protein [Actinomycetes bacterium]
MAYDEYLAQRVRDVIGAEVGVDEKKMFGGLAILLDGNMAVGVSGDELMVRVGVDAFDEALTNEGVRPFEMSGNRMNGWILAGGVGIAEDIDLERWVGVGMDYAGSLPPK